MSIFFLKREEEVDEKLGSDGVTDHVSVFRGLNFASLSLSLSSSALLFSDKSSCVRYDLGAIEDAMLSARPELWELDGRRELGKSFGESNAAAA